MVVVGGGSVLSLLFRDRAIVILPGAASTTNRGNLEGSEAGHLSRIPALPRMNPRLWKVRPFFFCACVHLVPITVRVTMTLFLRAILCPLEVGVALNVFSPRRKTAIPEYLEMVGSRKSDCLLCLCSLVTFIFFLTF